MEKISVKLCEGKIAVCPVCCAHNYTLNRATVITEKVDKLYKICIGDTTMELCESCLAELSEKIKWESKMIAEQAQVFIPLEPSAKRRQEILSARLGQTELLSQLTEECGELIQAAQKLRRVFAKTTKVTKDQALRNLIEEAADVALILDMLVRCKLLDRNGLQYIGRYKADRWYQRTLYPGAADMDCVYLDEHKNC